MSELRNPVGFASVYLSASRVSALYLGAPAANFALDPILPEAMFKNASGANSPAFGGERLAA